MESAAYVLLCRETICGGNVNTAIRLIRWCAQKPQEYRFPKSKTQNANTKRAITTLRKVFPEIILFTIDEYNINLIKK